MVDSDRTLGTALDARKGYTRTIVEDERPVSAAQLHEISEIMMRRVESICLGREKEIEAAVMAGVTRALDQAMADEVRIKRFWRTGFDELSGHTSDGASRWIGRRILTALLAAVAAGALALLVKTGKLP